MFIISFAIIDTLSLLKSLSVTWSLYLPHLIGGFVKQSLQIECPQLFRVSESLIKCLSTAEVHKNCFDASFFKKSRIIILIFLFCIKSSR